MALESSPDQTSRAVKHAMLLSRSRSSSSTSLSPNVSAAESSSSIECKLGNTRRHGTVDTSLPRVHSIGRAIDGLSTKVFQPDLINHHLDYQLKSSPSLSDESERDHPTNTPNSGTQDDLIGNGINIKKRLLDPGHSTKLNIPGNSVVVNDSDISQSDPLPICVLTAENLKPYPPGLITIVKEGPHESSSSLFLASIEKELKALEPSQKRKKSRCMDADEIQMDGVAGNGIEIKGCNCRIALQERLHATVKGYLHLQEQVALADSKCARWEKEAGDAAMNVSTLRAKVSELEIELAASNASLHGLKAKVAQQFMENDDINERRRQFERDCKAQLTQLDSLKKSEQWYREQLHLTQVERSTLQKQLMAAQEERVLQAHELEKLKTELKRIQDQLTEAEEKSVKEKQNFTIKLEKALRFSTDSFNVECNSSPKQEEDGHHVTELNQRISDLKLSLDSNHKTLSRSGEEIDRLLSRNLQLQRELSETKIKLQEEQDRHQSAAQEREKAEAELKQRDAALSQLSQEHASLAVRLECQERERAEQDEALEALTRNLSSMSARFSAMRAETQQQRAEAEALREEARAARGERDALRARAEDAARREQAAAAASRLQAGQREAARGAREAQLEHEVLGLREAAERARVVQQRVDQLQTERDQLSGLNEQLRAQLDRLSQLLQQNTGSRVRVEHGESQAEQLQAENNQLQAEKSQMLLEKTELQAEVEKGAMVKEQLETENHQLQGQVQRSAARLEELDRTIRGLEAEMADIREQQQQRSEEDDEDDAEAEALEAEMTRLRTDNAQLEREKHELAARAAELSEWLDAVTQGLGLGARGHAMERLARQAVSHEYSWASDGAADGDADALRALRAANDELALYAAALQRRLCGPDGPDGPDPAAERLRPDGPDLLSSAGHAGPAGQDGAEGDVAGLVALLQVCLHRVRAARAQDGDDGDDPLGGDVRRLASAIHGVLEAGPDGGPDGTEPARRPGPPELDGSAKAEAAQALQALQQEHRDLVDREWRRDELVRALMARLKDQVLARRAAERKAAALQALPGLQGPTSSCLGCPGAPGGATPAAGDGLAGREGEAEEVLRLEQELGLSQASVAELHKQLFGERRDASQLRKEVASLRLGLETANDMLDSNKVALGRSEAYGQVLKVSKEQLQERFDREQRDHEDCRTRLERLQDELQEARAKDPLLEAQIKTLGCHLHQRAGEVRALQERLELRDAECASLRAQLERQRAAARREGDALRGELRLAQREFADALREMSSSVPDPAPCDEEGLSALILQSNRLSPAVLDDLKALLHNLKAELRTVEREVVFPYEKTGPVVQHV